MRASATRRTRRDGWPKARRAAKRLGGTRTQRNRRSASAAPRSARRASADAASGRRSARSTGRRPGVVRWRMGPAPSLSKHRGGTGGFGRERGPAAPGRGRRWHRREGGVRTRPAGLDGGPGTREESGGAWGVDPIEGPEDCAAPCGGLLEGSGRRWRAGTDPWAGAARRSEKGRTDPRQEQSERRVGPGGRARALAGETRLPWARMPGSARRSQTWWDQGREQEPPPLGGEEEAAARGSESGACFIRDPHRWAAAGCRGAPASDRRP